MSKFTDEQVAQFYREFYNLAALETLWPSESDQLRERLERLIAAGWEINPPKPRWVVREPHPIKAWRVEDSRHPSLAAHVYVHHDDVLDKDTAREIAQMVADHLNETLP